MFTYILFHVKLYFTAISFHVRSYFNLILVSLIFRIHSDIEIFLRLISFFTVVSHVTCPLHVSPSGVIPPELGQLSMLQQLELQGNRLTGSIPRELGSLSCLHYLGLHDNQLIGTYVTSSTSVTRGVHPFRLQRSPEGDKGWEGYDVSLRMIGPFFSKSTGESVKRLWESSMFIISGNLTTPKPHITEIPFLGA